MFNAHLENQLIRSDITDVMQDYVSIQIDIDNTKVKAAALVAQNVDLKRIIKKAGLQRCVTPVTDADRELLELVIPAWCYFTYYRCLTMFQGTFTDSGYSTESEADDRNASKSVANNIKSIAETFMLDVMEFLDKENPNDKIDVRKITPRVRVYGGQERRASN